ncbi:MAG: hypothetical protein FWG30_10555 [Eubacteriaceae bacterium]|nr:hypothetical protein [Eubacteriaceae bacterium]
MKANRKRACLAIAIIMLLTAVSTTAFAANTAKGAAGERSRLHLRDGSCNGGLALCTGRGRRAGSGNRDGSGPLRDGSCGNPDCPLIQ